MQQSHQSHQSQQSHHPQHVHVLRSGVEDPRYAYDDPQLRPYQSGLPINAALRHPSRSPGFPYMLRILMLIICTCTCLLFGVIGTMTVAVVAPLGGEGGGERILGELRSGAIRRVVSSMGTQAAQVVQVAKGTHRPSTPPPPPSPPAPRPSRPSPSLPHSLPTWDRDGDQVRYDDGSVALARKRARPRTPDRILAALEGLVATEDGPDGAAGTLDWGRALEALPEWRRDDTIDSVEEVDERAVLGDLVRLLSHLYELLGVQHDALRNLTRTTVARKHLHGTGGVARLGVALNRTANANASTRVLP